MPLRAKQRLMVTQTQIAEQLGVSRQLVTLALAGYSQVAKATRERIERAARDLGYRPNPHARELRQKRTGIIALWIPDQISSHYSQVARELGRLAKQSGQELIISETGEADCSQIWSHVPVDGICAVDATVSTRRELESLAAKSVPVVSLGACDSPATDSVRVDMAAGTAEIMRHLLDSGYRRIAHATFVPASDDKESRRSGYEAAMLAAGLEPEYILYPLGETQRRITRRMIHDFLAQHGRPDAIFCHSDDAALGIYRGILDAGLRVPADIALVGCDGIEDTEYLECPLTTLVQPVATMCETAWRFLRNRLAEPGIPLQRSLLAPTLAIRESSNRPK